MKIDNKNFQHCLQCFQHPATWLSISGLLINDHILKDVSPSFITGKLSDISGLFFFPFIIATVLSIIIPGSILNRRYLGIVSFGLTTIWFVLLKTSNTINSLTTELVSIITGSSAYFVLDPTDLFAIIFIIPSWLIWTNHKPVKPKRIGYLALLVGLFASVATSGRSWGVSKVTNLEYYDDVVYAADTDGWGDVSFPVAESINGGVTWQPANMTNIEQKSVPITLCGRKYPEICYQVTRTGWLKIRTSDGDWEGVKGVILGGKVYDLIIFEWSEKEYVIAAIGQYGILRRELPNGDWVRYSVLDAEKE